MVGEKEAACWLVKHKPKDVGAVVVRLSNQLTGEADASICLFDYAVLEHQGIIALREFSTRMRELLRYWGSRLWPCERSVFVVFYNWEKFVGEMPWPQVLGWLEERKLEWLERLKNMSRQWRQEKGNVPKELTEGSEVSATDRRVGRNAAAQGNQDVGVSAFGGLRWRLWAVSLQSQGRPTGVPE
ncbi:MAG: hypothetical protein NZM42_13525, partial [Gemmatales bacterium]|nr:hypothetical protein [Gemmatales bacterium]